MIVTIGKTSEIKNGNISSLNVSVYSIMQQVLEKETLVFCVDNGTQEFAWWLLMGSEFARPLRDLCGGEKYMLSRDLNDGASYRVLYDRNQYPSFWR